MIQFGGRSVVGLGDLAPEDSGKTESLTVGDTTVIRLPGGDGPGSGWVLTPGDPKVIDVASTTANESTTTFTLVAKGTGSTHLEFAYRHPFEHQTPIKVVAFDFTVAGRWWKIALGVAAAIAAGGITYAAARKKKR